MYIFRHNKEICGYVVVGGGCMIQNFGEYDKDRVTIVRDIFDFANGS